MKKTISMLCVVLVVGFAGTSFAGKKVNVKKEKVDVCHNGSVYTGDISDDAVYDPEAWEPGYFVINISGRAVTKHVVNHGDLLEFIEGDDVITEVTIGDDGAVDVIITGFETQPSCGAEVIE